MDDPKRGEIVQVGFPAKFSEDLNYKRSPVPYFGEHTEEVLTGLSYTSDQIQDLKDDGVI
jgi:crotonobetainyl-CoA:carnitine CoA-transferase CaiB-like acyl-CoA transferase